MEKFGLFDLIDKLNFSANGKKEFANKQTGKQDDGNKNSSIGDFLEPTVYPPKHYMMNEKMIDFCKKHDEFKKSAVKTQ